MKIHFTQTMVLLLLAAATWTATPPALVNYQGVLRDAAGAPRTGSFDMVFRFYNLVTAGTLLLTDTHNAAAPSGQVALTNGLFTAQLGAGTIAAGTEPNLAEMFRDNAAVWLEIQVGTETLSPRVRVIASAYAQNAKSLDGNDASAFAAAGHNHDPAYVNEGQAVSITASMIVDGATLAEILDDDGAGSGLDADLLDGQHASAFQSAGSAWALAGNAGTTPGTNFVGTTDAQALELKVNAARALRLEPNAASPNLIGGHSGNWVAAGAFGAVIGGGGQNTVLNRVVDHMGVIGGGQNNQAGTDDATVGNQNFATVSGGWNNTASGGTSTIGGGRGNTASNGYASIGGGYSNQAGGDYAFIGGGRGNQVSGPYSYIGGGYSNQASGSTTYGFGAVVAGYGNNAAGDYAFIGGGAYNTIDLGGLYNGIGCGYSNLITGGGWDNSIVGGKLNSITGGTYSVIAGGLSNSISGSYSFAAGHRAKSNAAGSFVWADSTDADFACDIANRFAVRAGGGVYFQTPGVGIGTATPGFPLTFPNSLGDKISLWGQSGNHYGFGVQSNLLIIHTDVVGSDVAFGYGQSGTFTEVMRIKGNGYVGIGTAVPTYQLELSVNSAAKPTGGLWTTLSDARIKKNIRPFFDGLEVIGKINPVRYQFNGLAGMPKDMEGIGVIAQEVKGAAPYTVGTVKKKLNPDDAEKTALYDFDGSPLIWVMVNAIKELDERTKGLAGKEADAPDTRELSAEPKQVDGKERLQPGEPVPDTPARPAVSTGAAVQMLPAIEGVEPGDVLVLNPANGDELYKCNTTADPMVVGVAAVGFSSLPTDQEEPVVTSGVTLVKADATLAPIAKGDLLVASGNPGHAMKMGIFVPGTVIGKALEDLTTGTGLIRVLVMLR